MPPVGDLEQPRFAVLGVGEGALLVAEQLALEEVAGRPAQLTSTKGARPRGPRPDAFYPDRPDRGAVRAGSASYAISPGFFRATDAAPALWRDLPKWAARVRKLRAAKVRWRLVNSFNDWADG